jgi:glucose-1-phosphate thymidylyltransferase
MGFKVKAEVLDSWWLDTGKKDDILTANQIILDQYLKGEVLGTIEESEIKGSVRVVPGARVTKSKIQGPCIIGKGAVVENSFVGPYTSIGEGSQVINSGIENCILLEFSMVKDVAHLEDSLLGKHSLISRTARVDQYEPTSGTTPRLRFETSGIGVLICAYS